MIFVFLSLIFFGFDLLDELEEAGGLDVEVELEFWPPPFPSASAMANKIVNANARNLQNT